MHSKQVIWYYHHQLCNSIVGSYDRSQHVIILDLDLVQYYLNIRWKNLGVKWQCKALEFIIK